MKNESCREKGFSLVELMIYAFLTVLILGVVFRMMVLNRRQMERPAATFRIQQELLSVHRYLERDLEETRLSSIRIYPNSSHPNALPGISLASPRSIDDDTLKLSPTGFPIWQKIIYYFLEKDPRHSSTARLVRREGTISGYPSALPLASSYEPSTAPSNRRRERIAAKSLLLPGEKIPLLSRQLGPAGGFEVYFSDARGGRSLDDFRNYRLITIILWAGAVSQTTGKSTVLSYPIQVVPRN
ncbi:MAG: hypothetical protein V2A78_08120 [bacterium]